MKIFTDKVEDQNFKRMKEVFTEPVLKYTKIDYDMIVSYPNEMNSNPGERSILDYPLRIKKDTILDLEHESGIIYKNTLVKLFKYKLDLWARSDDKILQAVICTADSKKSKKVVDFKDDNPIPVDIIFLCDDDADEKIEILENIINNGIELSPTDVEVLYLMLTPFMGSELSRGELLLKVANLTNLVKGLDDFYIEEIKLFQLGLLKKFDLDVELKKEVARVIGDYRELHEALFADQINEIKDNVIADVALNMKNRGDDYASICEVTGISIDDIKKL